MNKRRTRKAVFLDEMSLVVPWSELAQPDAPPRLAFINPMGRLIELTAELLVS